MQFSVFQLRRVRVLLPPPYQGSSHRSRNSLFFLWIVPDRSSPYASPAQQASRLRGPISDGAKQKASPSTRSKGASCSITIALGSQTAKNNTFFAAGYRLVAGSPHDRRLEKGLGDGLSDLVALIIPRLDPLFDPQQALILTARQTTLTSQVRGQDIFVS